MASEPPDLPPVISVTLSEADWEQFIEVLENPPAPTDELKKLMTENGPKGDNKPFTLGSDTGSPAGGPGPEPRTAPSSATGS
jgi:hypothetical protein